MVIIVEFIKDVFKYIVIIGIIILIRIYVLTSAVVVGDSMVPTLTDGNFLMVEQLTSRFNTLHRFDIVVIKYDSPSFIIKRIIGLPGEKIKYINNMLFVNDYMVKEEFDHIGEVENFEIIVPQNSFFVIGDNRNVSEDSRFFGPINKDEIIGRPILTIWPISDFGINK